MFSRHKVLTRLLRRNQSSYYQTWKKYPLPFWAGEFFVIFVILVNFVILLNFVIFMIFCVFHEFFFFRTLSFGTQNQRPLLAGLQKRGQLRPALNMVQIRGHC